ncbi:Outer membrane protein assembly factor BamA [bacterium HR37]|nr:Outer membrane protein assembly factor BamA [bacterium HR37]
MRIDFAKALFYIGFALICLISSKSSFAEERIVGIDIRGNKKIEAELIRMNISAKVGEPLSTDVVRRDIKNIYKLGFFEDVIAEVERLPEGVRLIYVVKEKPVVVDLRIRGNKKIKTDKIMEVVQVDEGRIIDLEKVRRSAEAIEKLYSEKGIVPTRVDFTIEPRGEGMVSVIFDIEEGKKAFIKEVRFVGNRDIKSKELRKVVYSKPKSFFSFITQRGVFNREEIERDTDRIRLLYLDRGYLDVNVSKPEIVYSEEKKGFIVTFRIEEGKQYSVGNVSFEGDLIAPESELLGLLKTKGGRIFSRSELAEDVSKLTTFYGDKGYAFANVEPRFKVNREELTVDITFSIEKGKLVYIRFIDIVGNTRTRDKVIRREIPIEEQQLYSSSKIQAIKGRVGRLGFFEENIEVTTERVPDAEDKIDVNVKVKERPTGFFSIAGGFSSVETFIFAGQIQESNLFGYGKRLSLSAQIGGVTQLFILNYQDPNLFDTDWQLDLLVFRTDREFRDFDRSSYGTTLSVGRRLISDLSGRVSYRFEHVDIGDVSGDAALIIRESKRNISSIGFGLIWDSRNNFLDPSKGNISRASVEFAGGPFGGNTDFIKSVMSTRFFFPLWFKTVFSVAGEYGIIDLRNAGDDLVVSERFFLGGPGDLRGFEFRRVGPRVPTDDGDFVIIGGTQEVIFTAEYIFPILPQAGLKGVLFFDMGNAFNDNEDLSLNPGDLRKDVGFGFRWISPLGPLRLEIGFPVGKRLPGEDPFEVQFTVGTLF